MFSIIGNFFTTVFDFGLEMLWMALIVVFVQNTILSRGLGASASLYIIRKNNSHRSIMFFGLVLSILSTIAAGCAYFLYPYVKNNGYERYMPLIFIGCIVVIYLIAVIIIRIFFWKSQKKLISMIHLSAFNSVVLGGMFLINTEGLTGTMGSLAKSIGFGLGLGLGFTVATLMILQGYNHLNSKHVPRAFRGFPVTLIYIGILSMAFYGAIGGRELLS